MKTAFEKVGDFHRKFGLTSVPDAPGEHVAKPDLPAHDVHEFRMKFLREELDEIETAFREGNIEKYADGLADLAYVTYGTAHLAHIPLDRVFSEVHRANMRKERAASASDPRSKRSHSLDVVKPVGWTPPNIGAALFCYESDDDPLKWDRRFMDLAFFVCRWSKDPSTRVGAVVVNGRQVAIGYNGFPPGIEDRADRLADRELKYRLIQHAERNVLDLAGFPLNGATLYSTLPPCTECAKSVISKRVARVVTTPLDRIAPHRGKWREEATFARSMLFEAGVFVDEVDCD